MYWAAQYIHLNVPYIYLNVQSYKVWKWFFFFFLKKVFSLAKNTLATSCKELTHWKRPWCWEGLGAGGGGDDRGWDGWMVSLTQWTWVWVDSGSWWWTGRPGVLRFMRSQRVGHDWATELNWTELKPLTTLLVFPSFYFFKYQDNKMVSFLGTLWELFKIYTEVEFFWWGSMFASASVLWRQAIHSHFKLTYLFGFFRSQK